MRGGKMELVFVMVSSAMLIGSIWFFVRNEDRETSRASVVNKAALSAVERMEAKFDIGIDEINKLSQRVTTLEQKPAVAAQPSAIPSRITVEIIDKPREVSVRDNADSVKALDTLRAVRARQKKPVYSRTTQ